MPDSAGVTLTWLGCCRLLLKNFSVQRVIKRFLYSIVIFIPVFFFLTIKTQSFIASDRQSFN